MSQMILEQEYRRFSILRNYHRQPRRKGLMYIEPEFLGGILRKQRRPCLLCCERMLDVLSQREEELLNIIKYMLYEVTNS